MNRVRNFSDAELSPEEKSAIRLLVSKKILDPSVWTTDNFTDAELLTVCKDALREQAVAPTSAPSVGVKRKAQGSHDEIEGLVSPETFASWVHGKGPGIPHNGLRDLHVKRTHVVDKIIELVDKSEGKNLFLHGPAGSGKTVLLSDIGLALEKRGKNVLIANTAASLDFWYNENFRTMTEAEPDYMLVDEVQDGFHLNGVRYFAGKTKEVSNIKTRTVFAGIPSEEGKSSILEYRSELSDLLLDAGEVLEQNVVDFFKKMAKEVQKGVGRQHEMEEKQITEQEEQTAEQEEQTAEQDGVVESVRTSAVRRAIQFALYYTSGHAYPFLRLVQFFVTHLSSAEMTEERMAQAMTSNAFFAAEGPYQDIKGRCFRALLSPQGLMSSLFRDCDKHPNEVARLSALGLWADDWLLSPLLHMVLLKEVRPSLSGPPAINGPQDIGKALHFCCTRLRREEFYQRDYSLLSDEDRTRCEDGVSFFVGRHLVALCGAVSFQHNVLPPGVKKAGRPPSVDFYLNSKLDMFVEVVKNGSTLAEHFSRFNARGKYATSGKAFAVLDIDFEHATPLPLPIELKRHESKFYTYCVRSCNFFDGAGERVAWA